MTGDFNLAYGGQKWGNFVSVNRLNTGRFLDPPEFQVMHAKGNEQNYSIASITGYRRMMRLHLEYRVGAFHGSRIQIRSTT